MTGKAPDLDHLIIRDQEVWTRDPAMWLAGSPGYILRPRRERQGGRGLEGDITGECAIWYDWVVLVNKPWLEQKNEIRLTLYREVTVGDLVHGATTREPTARGREGGARVQRDQRPRRVQSSME